MYKFLGFPITIGGSSLCGLEYLFSGSHLHLHIHLLLPVLLYSFSFKIRIILSRDAWGKKAKVDFV